MMVTRPIALLGLLAFLGTFVAASPRHVLVRREVSEMKRICYFVSWSQYRAGIGKYVSTDVDPHLCTHIIYSFAKLNGNTFMVEDYEWNDKQQIAALIALKKKNTDLKVMVAIGGWNAGTWGFQQMAATASTRAKFIKSLIAYMKKHDLDGFDCDWEYPGAADTTKFTALMKELRASFGSEYLISIASGVGADKLKNYAFEQFHQYVDWLGMMTYDMAGQWDKKTGFHSALYGSGTLNDNWVISELLRRNVPAGKIVLGIPTYGRSFTQSRGDDCPLGTPASGGKAEKYTATGGFAAYYEICMKVKSGSYTEKVNRKDQSAYAYGGDQWVGYDNIETTKVKCEYALKKGLGGTMVWDLSMDDYGNQCGYGKNPISETIKAVFAGQTGTVPAPVPVPAPSPSPMPSPSPSPSPMPSPSPSPSPMPSPSPSPSPMPSPSPSPMPSPSPSPMPSPSPSPMPSPSPSPMPSPSPSPTPGGSCNSVFKCPRANGFFANDCDCKKYYRCVRGRVYRKRCPSGLLWDAQNTVCNWPGNVTCK